MWANVQDGAFIAVKGIGGLFQRGGLIVLPALGSMLSLSLAVLGNTSSTLKKFKQPLPFVGVVIQQCLIKGLIRMRIRRALMPMPFEFICLNKVRPMLLVT